MLPMNNVPGVDIMVYVQDMCAPVRKDTSQLIQDVIKVTFHDLKKNIMKTCTLKTCTYDTVNAVMFKKNYLRELISSYI